MHEFSNILSILSIQQDEESKQEIIASLEYSEKFGLTLTDTDINNLSESRHEALRRFDLVEFGGGITPKLIRAFCNSPYTEQSSFADTLSMLQDAFYCFRREAGETLSDDELIEYMVSFFDNEAGGSAEYLAEVSLSELLVASAVRRERR